MTYTRYYNGLDMNVQISTLLYQAKYQYCSSNYEQLHCGLYMVAPIYDVLFFAMPL